MKIKELIEKLKKHDQNKDLVIYSNESDLIEYNFLGVYENEGQVELHIDEGEKLQKGKEKKGGSRPQARTTGHKPQVHVPREKKK